MTPTVFIGRMKLVDLLRAEQVLLNLVFDDAVAGFFDGEPRERLGLRRGRGGHRVDDGVDLRLAEFGELEPGLLGAASQRAGFGDRGEVAIGLEAAPAGFGHPAAATAPLGRIFSTSACGRGMTWTETSSPTRRAAAAPASVAALTAPTSPRTITVT